MELLECLPILNSKRQSRAVFDISNKFKCVPGRCPIFSFSYSLSCVLVSCVKVSDLLTDVSTLSKYHPSDSKGDFNSTYQIFFVISNILTIQYGHFLQVTAKFDTI